MKIYLYIAYIFVHKWNIFLLNKRITNNETFTMVGHDSKLIYYTYIFKKIKNPSINIYSFKRIK